MQLITVFPNLLIDLLDSSGVFIIEKQNHNCRSKVDLICLDFGQFGQKYPALCRTLLNFTIADDQVHVH